MESQDKDIIEFGKSCLEKLKPGMVFPSYKSLCEFVGTKYVGGNYKTGRMNKLGELFSYQIEGWKITLLEKKEGADSLVTKSKEEKRNTKYADNIQNCLLYTLNKNKKEKLVLSIGRALKLCNMINENFIEARKDVDLASEALDINKLYIYSFFNTEQKKMKANFERSLNIMKNKSLIEYNKVMMVYRKNVSIVKNELHEPAMADNGDVLFLSSDNYEVATDEERRLIARIQREVLNEMSFDNKKDAFLGGKWKVFKEEVDKRLLKRGNIFYFFEAYDIVYSNDFIEHEVKKIEQQLSLKDLNEKVLQSCSKSAKTSHNRAVKDKEIGKKNTLMYGDSIKLKEDYIEKYNMLANILIKEKPEINLKEKMYSIRESKTKCSSIIDEMHESMRVAQLEYEFSF